RPHMQGQQMLGPVLGAHAPVANQALAESNKGIARGLRRIVINAGAAKESAKLGRIRQRLVDAALQRPTCTCRHRKSPSTTVNHMGWRGFLFNTTLGPP